ncbi:uncharacterized protein LDX57_000096 [Aspergillus melleus]|uniref:uncharacterized protein n=1 Tax=Aspergillus melleus TaxID=138277 RepID=UPI001E8ED286|nr:uncharacterized protein LDX57_000096 [Aspergillus melleus]KAH8422339.1 hypothetical protein LDX57_000096 [Aspergillus melleus]
MVQLDRPIVGDPEQLEVDVRHLYKCHEEELKHVVDVNLLIKGAEVARQPTNVTLPCLNDTEKEALKKEKTLGFFQQTKDLKVTILTTACAAITQ